MPKPYNETAIIIPTRLASHRLPGKPLADIHGIPMVVRVAMQAKASDIGEVFIACADQKIADIVREYGYSAILTDPSLPSGTDRVYAAYLQLRKSYNIIVNVQGDMPLIKPSIIKKTWQDLCTIDADITTPVAQITEYDQITSPSIVKAIFSTNRRALYFTRAACPFGSNSMHKHIGIYCYRKEALECFANCEVTELEKMENLEQLRCLENGLSVFVTIVENAPISVDTEEDLMLVRLQYMSKYNTSAIY